MGGRSSKQVSLEDLPTLAEKVVVIIGDSSGFGSLVIESIASKSPYKIIIAETRIDDGSGTIRSLRNDFPSVKFIHKQLDLSSFKSIENFYTILNDEIKCIDILIDNVCVNEALYNKQTEQGFNMTVGTLAIGTAYLTSKLLPLIVKSIAPRVVLLLCDSIFRLDEKRFERFMVDFGGDHLKINEADATAFARAINALYAYELQKRLRAMRSNAIVVCTLRDNLVRSTSASSTTTSTTTTSTSHPSNSSCTYHTSRTISRGALSAVYCATSSEMENIKYHGRMVDYSGTPKLYRIPGSFFSPENCRRVYHAIGAAVQSKGRVF